MSSKKHLALALLAALIVFGAGFGLLVWPALREASDVTAQIEELGHKNRTLEERTGLVQLLHQELATARSKVARTLKRIPASGETYDLLEQLSMPADGYFVVDQEIAAERSKEAVLDEEISARAVPVTVVLEARYEAVQEIIRRAEASDRLVRVASVNVRRHPDKSSVANDDDALLKATIKLEAIFDPHAGEDGAQ